MLKSPIAAALVALALAFASVALPTAGGHAAAPSPADPQADTRALRGPEPQPTFWAVVEHDEG